MTSKAQPYVGPPVPMSREDMTARRDRLREVIPQLEEKVGMLARKRGKEDADALREKIKSLKTRLGEYDSLLGEKGE